MLNFLSVRLNYYDGVCRTSSVSAVSMASSAWHTIEIISFLFYIHCVSSDFDNFVHSEVDGWA